MGLLEDIMKTLERIPIWKRLVQLPAETEALEKRIAALEAKLQPKTGSECPMCEDLAMNRIKTADHPEWSFAGMKLDTLKCQSCGHEETRDRQPPK